MGPGRPLHSDISPCGGSYDIESFSEFSEPLTFKGYAKEISEHLGAYNMVGGDPLGFEEITKVIIAYIDVFALFC